MAQAAAVLQPESHNETMSIGLDDAYRKEMAESLTEILAGTYGMIIKNHVYHWNVVGPLFKPLHELTEEHYEELFEAADTIAERIRALGHLAPESLKAIADFAPDAKSVKHMTAESMVKDLIKDHEKCVRDMRKAAGKAGDASDLVTEDMLTARLTFHEKALWMLRATVAD